MLIVIPSLSYQIITIGILFGLISIFLPLSEWCRIFRGFGAEKKILLIGILSAQENSVQRNFVRGKWLMNINPNITDYKFLIGEDICSIHPLDRLSPFECRYWNVSLHGLKNVTNGSTTPVTVPFENPLYSGFTFLVKHDIIVKQIGILNEILCKNKDKVFRVGLFDSASGSKLYSASFIFNVDKPDSEFLWKKTSEILLKKGFEGEIRILEGENALPVTGFCNLLSPNNIIRIFEVLTGSVCEAHLPHQCSAVALSFIVSDVNNLERFIVGREFRAREWEIKAKNLKIELQKEQDQNKDLLFLPVVDSYKNLSVKIENFFKWVSDYGKWQYVMKTDDDVLIDINKVESELLLGNFSWDIWSCFRENWPVPKSGKWRDCLGNHKVYPPFPSGAGYVLKSDSIPLVNSSERGEDVAIGLQFSKLSHVKHHGLHCQWTCGLKKELPCDLDLLPDHSNKQE